MPVFAHACAGVSFNLCSVLWREHASAGGVLVLALPVPVRLNSDEHVRAEPRAVAAKCAPTCVPSIVRFGAPVPTRLLLPIPGKGSVVERALLVLGAVAFALAVGNTGRILLKRKAREAERAH